MHKHVRKTHKKQMLDALFPRVRQEVLATLTLNPERRWYESELARYLNMRPSSLQRELNSLAQADIISETPDGNRVYVQIKSGIPFLAELQSIFVKTIGLADKIKEALNPFDQEIQFAFIFGSIASGQRTTGSDIDLLIIGEARMPDLSTALDRVEAEVQSPINAMLYSQQEFASKLKQKDHFLSTVSKTEKIFLKGTEDELAEAFSERQTQAARHEPARVG